MIHCDINRADSCTGTPLDRLVDEYSGRGSLEQKQHQRIITAIDSIGADVGLLTRNNKFPLHYSTRWQEDNILQTQQLVP